MFRVDFNRVLFNRVGFGIKLLELEVDGILIILGVSCFEIKVLNVLDLDFNIGN